MTQLQQQAAECDLLRLELAQCKQQHSEDRVRRAQEHKEDCEKLIDRWHDTFEAERKAFEQQHIESYATLEHEHASLKELHAELEAMTLQCFNALE